MSLRVSWKRSRNVLPLLAMINYLTAVNKIFESPALRPGSRHARVDPKARPQASSAFCSRENIPKNAPHTTAYKRIGIEHSYSFHCKRPTPLKVPDAGRQEHRGHPLP